MYIIGLLGALFINSLFLKVEHKAGGNYNKNITNDSVIDASTIAFLCAIIGGRLFYVIFYNFSHYLAHPEEILAVHKGGMSFHGGFVGAVFGLWFATRKEKNFWQVADVAASVAPFALFVGRIGNFINDELWGRTTDVPWAVNFPSGGYVPRHPSQLYEAVLEGILLLIICLVLRSRRIPRPGLIAGTFIVGYAISRIIVEFFRQPDAQIGYYADYFTQGQLLSLPMLLVGI